MIKEENLKIIMVFFVAAAFLAAFVARGLLESFATYFSWVAMMYGQEWVRHGVPVVVGLSIFCGLQLKEQARIWAHEVIVEVRKVVWPSQKITGAMTMMVCIILLISGFVLGLFDLAGAAVIDFIIK